VNAVIRPRARDDIIRQFRWYLVKQDTAEAAYRFLDALEESVRQLLSMPHMGSPRALKNRHLEGLRAWPVKGFEEIYIFYLTQGETVRVIRVSHGRRDLERILKQESVDHDTIH
jgi:toxin ParE1/3/4